MRIYFTVLLIMCLQLTTFSQIQGNAAKLPETSNKFDSVSTITISVYSQMDSTGYKIACTRVEGKDAILIKVNTFKGLTVDFHRSMAKSMFKQPLDSYETEISIRTVFEGKYYLDIINSSGVKIKTFLIEKKL